MTLNARSLPKAGGTKFPPVGTGTYPARLAWFIVSGIQPQREFKGEKKPPALEIRLVWELLDEFLPDEDGEPDPEKPRFIWEKMGFYDLDNTKANSTKRYYGVDPTESAGGDWGKLIGTPVMLGIAVNKSKDGNEYNNVSNVSPMRTKEAAKAPPLVNEPLVFDFYEPDLETLKRIPGWLRDYFTQAVDYKGSDLEQMIESMPEDGDDEIPFKGKAKEAPKTKAPVEEDDEEGWT